MWDTFIPDLIVTAVGASLTVAIAAVTFIVNRRFQETRALNLLVQELHHRRALIQIDALMEVHNAEQSNDFARVNASVLSIRDAVRDARGLSRPVATVQVPLSGITSACNRYLELAARHPSRYWFFLMDLRADIKAQISALAKSNRRVGELEPGAGSL